MSSSLLLVYPISEHSQVNTGTPLLIDLIFHCLFLICRQDLLQQWTATCKTKGIRISDDFSLQKILSSAIEIREWNLCGLPTDEVSSENGILMNRARRWPLLIDPQSQANTWIKTLYSKDGLRVIKLTESNFLKVLEGSIRVGNPVLLEDIGESFDPVLEPILQKSVVNIGGRSVIKIGDSEIDYDPKFRLFLTTKLPNPHYLPEVCNKVTIINFTVTMKVLTLLTYPNPALMVS